MAILTVRKLDDAVYASLGERARRNKRSLEAEVRTILEREVAKPQEFDLDTWIARVSVRSQQLAKERGPLPDSLSLIRAVRDEE